MAQVCVSMICSRHTELYWYIFSWCRPTVSLKWIKCDASQKIQNLCVFEGCAPELIGNVPIIIVKWIEIVRHHKILSESKMIFILCDASHKNRENTMFPPMPALIFVLFCDWIVSKLIWEHVSISEDTREHPRGRNFIFCVMPTDASHLINKYGTGITRNGVFNPHNHFLWLLGHRKCYWKLHQSLVWPAGVYFGYPVESSHLIQAVYRTG